MTRALPPHTYERAKAPAVGGSPEAPGPPPGKPEKPRDSFFDNTKLLAIVLVACGHAWQPLTSSSRTAEALYMVVYAFHMPAFIIVSGYFSRSFDARPDRLVRLVTGVVVPYVVFEVAYSLFKRYADDDPTHAITLLDPWYLTWFLVALFVWRLTAPLWRIVRWPVPLALAIASLAAISPDIGDDLDLQRVLQFLPFFVFGLSLRPEHFKLVRRRSVRIAAVPVFAVALVVAYWAAPRMSSAWFYHRDSAQELGAPWWTGLVMTMALFACSIVLSACFFAWTPGRRLWVTALGASTLYGYLLHGFLAKGSRFWGWYDVDWVRTPLGMIAVTFIAVAIILVLCTTPFQRIFRPVMEPKMAWAFRLPARGPRQAAPGPDAPGAKASGADAPREREVVRR
ncbi:acyltransferase family protein [Streptomyces sp. SCUT-3]|uniref:acyltransferase family protein n=1 Tax=Streptomyces sp. SCUT-3 TaxID=2684469 RepID=UPI0015FC42DA|nr:acyltransferase family protein [Streptomyces sp. SCUT-3]QMV23423.1 acyltransferase family protein [Streptomyces sp. SCUT-3]